jgi:hypothetical protein
MCLVLGVILSVITVLWILYFKKELWNSKLDLQ